jgi:type I restriction enzyme, S subunit
MDSDRQIFQLDEVFDFRSGLSKPRNAFGAGHPFLTFKDVFYNFFVPDELGDLVNSTETERATGDIRRGDVFLTRTSETRHELGMSCVALSDVPNGTFNGFTKRLRPKPTAQIIPEYAAYYFRSPEFRERISAISTLSTRASLNEAMLAQLQIALPDVDTQISIGVILKSLDDKITLLRKMNRTLEGIARAVFRAWFVDFEPVRAKAAGATSFRGMPQDFFDTLPDQLEQSEIGEIPKGWMVGNLGSLVGLRNERIKAGAETEALPYVPIDCIDSQSVWLMQEKPGTEAQSSLVKVYPNDILFGAMRPYFHKVSISPFEATTRTTVFVLRPNRASDLPYSLMVLSEEKTIEFATTSSVGSTIPYAKWEGVLERFQIPIPPAQTREAFGNCVSAIIHLGMSTKPEVDNLISLRDTLLPKLISGELEAPSLEALGLKAVSDGR